MEAWIEFVYNNEVIGSYTVRGTFAGEMQATKELLATERGISPDEIITQTVTK